MLLAQVMAGSGFAMASAANRRQKWLDNKDADSTEYDNQVAASLASFDFKTLVEDPGFRKKAVATLKQSGAGLSVDHDWAEVFGKLSADQMVAVMAWMMNHNAGSTIFGGSLYF